MIDLSQDERDACLAGLAYMRATIFEDQQTKVLSLQLYKLNPTSKSHHAMERLLDKLKGTVPQPSTMNKPDGVING